MNVEKALTDICRKIDRKIDANSRPEIVAQDIVTELRHLVEHVAVMIYEQHTNHDHNVDNDFQHIKSAMKFIKAQGQFKWLYKFHNWTQKSVSHYSPDEDSSYRLMLKYYAHLLNIRRFLKDNYDLNVLHMLDSFPISTSPESQKYYGEIAQKISKVRLSATQSIENTRYYVQDTRQFFVDGKVYYQVSFTIADDSVSKFDNMLAFSSYEIPTNYAVKFDIRTEEIEIVDGVRVSIFIIDNHEISIRTCEFKNFAKVFGEDIEDKRTESKQLMEYLTQNNLNLVDLMEGEECVYEYAKQEVLKCNGTRVLFPILDKCRKLIREEQPGSNVLRYLLYCMNNPIIKKQLGGDSCSKLSGLYLDYGCIPFDQMPFVSSLKGHNPKRSYLLECLDDSGREHEHLAKVVSNNTEIGGRLFTPEDELRDLGNIDSLVAAFNGTLYYKHGGRKLVRSSGHVSIRNYTETCKSIFDKLLEFSTVGLDNYTIWMDYQLSLDELRKVGKDQKNVLRRAFAESQVALISGAAGTGKTATIRHLSDIFGSFSQCFLANTNAAVQNLERRMTTSSNYVFMTVSKFIKLGISESVKLFVIDECSTVSNADILAVLEKARFEMLVLVGDPMQIESIQFGNWFSYLKDLLPSYCVFELTETYRSNVAELLDLWRKVRNVDDDIVEHLERYDFSEMLNEEFFALGHSKNEIILCLNYHGLHGINNINHILQNSNRNSSVQWEKKIYKVGDPVLFNEINRFSPLIYNNCAGRIVRIEKYADFIVFDIEVEKVIIDLEANIQGIELLPVSEEGKSVIRFSVFQSRNSDEDDDGSLEHKVPFNVAYAVSIHRAQGLEYDSVKVIISDDYKNQITHNILYTAITRAKRKLKIYWTPATQQSVLSRLKPKDNNKDMSLLKYDAKL